jgi:hypothetical protein
VRLTGGTLELVATEDRMQRGLGRAGLVAEERLQLVGDAL